MKRGWFTFGLAGSLVAAACCFTPLLPALLGAIGLSHYLGHLYRDDVLLPLLGGFLILTGYGYWRMRRS